MIKLYMNTCMNPTEFAVFYPRIGPNRLSGWVPVRRWLVGLYDNKLHVYTECQKKLITSLEQHSLQ